MGIKALLNAMDTPELDELGEENKAAACRECEETEPLQGRACRRSDANRIAGDDQKQCETLDFIRVNRIVALPLKHRTNPANCRALHIAAGAANCNALGENFTGYSKPRSRGKTQNCRKPIVPRVRITTPSCDRSNR